MISLRSLLASVSHCIKYAVIILTAAGLLVCNLSAWRQYSVEEDEFVRIDGMPLAYRITFDSAALPPDVGSIQPPPRPALMPFSVMACALNAFMGGLILAVQWLLLFRFLPRIAQKKWTKGLLPYMIATVLAALVILGCNFVVRRYGRQQDIFAQVNSVGGTISTEYPGPDVLWTAFHYVAKMWYSDEQIGSFLDWSVGTAVKLRGPANVLPLLSQLPHLKAVVIEVNVPETQDFSRTAVVRLGISAEQSCKIERAELTWGIVNDPTDLGLKEFAELPRLRFLTVNGCPSADAIGQLHRLKNLEVLNLCQATIPEGTIRFSELPRLKSLSLANVIIVGNSTITEETTRELAGLSHLKDLDLSDNTVSKDAIKSLANIASLKNLNLDSDDVGDTEMEALAALHELRFLGVASSVKGASTLTDAGVRHIGQLKRLIALNLGSTKITDQGVASLTALPNLQILDLRDTDISDASVPSLLKLSSLRDLFLEGTRITAAGALRLQQLPSLRTLKVGGCPSISSAEMTELQQQMPKVNIIGQIQFWPASAIDFDKAWREGRW